MNYTLHQLFVFVKVVETASVTKASEELHMTQPAVSIQLKNFQDQFEIPLTEVIGRQIYVTEFGKEIYEIAKRIFEEVNSINYKTEAYKGNLNGKLVLSIVSTGKYVMPYFLSDFLKENQGVDLVMDVTNKSRVIESLQKNEIDFALVSLLPEGMKVNEEVLLTNELFVIGNSTVKNPKKPISKNELKEMPLIYREEGSGTRYVMESYFNKHSIKVRKKMELTSNEAVKQAVIAGLGYSIMPLIGIKNELLNGELKIIPAVGFPIRSKWRMIWLKGKMMTPIADAFIRHIKENKATILNENFDWIEKFNT
ncbi:MAG: LysR family transcriptional regulator [Bacteroidota bacterium]